jgi:hypothetical protein
MRFPTQRLTITPAEYKLLKPGLDVLANGLADAKAGHFPHRHPWHLIDWVASDVYGSQAYDDEMAVRVTRVRRKLWDLNQSRKIRIDAFELSALALALRLSRAQKLVDATQSISTEIRLLQFKIELYRKRAKRSAIARIRRLEYQSSAERWRRFVAWLRYNTLYLRLPERGEARPATLWREQRRQLTELINKSLVERFFETPSDVEMVKIVTLATRSLRRGRHRVSLRELLRAPQAHNDFLAGFVERRVELKRLPGALVPEWQAVSDRADKFKEYQERNRGEIVEPSSISPDKIITEEQDHQVTTTPKVKTLRRYTHERQVLTSEILVDAMAEWLYQNVTMKFNFTTEVCEQARFQITHGLLEPYRVKTAATSFNGLMKELRPVEFSDDSAILISEIAGWLLGCLLATGQQPRWMHRAFGAAGNRAKRMEEKARYDEWAATLANGSQIAAIRA